jgi:hypothetical protein
LREASAVFVLDNIHIVCDELVVWLNGLRKSQVVCNACETRSLYDLSPFGSTDEISLEGESILSGTKAPESAAVVTTAAPVSSTEKPSLWRQKKESISRFISGFKKVRNYVCMSYIMM